MASGTGIKRSFKFMSEINFADITGVKIQENDLILDQRGSFLKFFDKGLFGILETEFTIRSMVAATTSEAGTVRGLHFQRSPYQEEKVVICLRGEIVDVIVDLRSDSATLGQWAQISLSGDKPTTICLPKGIAHGYQTLTEDVTVLYGLSNLYSSPDAFSLNYRDSTLGIQWPLPTRNISSKDLDGISLQEAIKLMQEEESNE